MTIRSPFALSSVSVLLAACVSAPTQQVPAEREPSSAATLAYSCVFKNNSVSGVQVYRTAINDNGVFYRLDVVPAPDSAPAFENDIFRAPTADADFTLKGRIYTFRLVLSIGPMGGGKVPAELWLSQSPNQKYPLICTVK